MKTISMLEFRLHARRALDALRRGERWLLTYRGEPVARLEPVGRDHPAVAGNDTLLHVDDCAVDGPGEPLGNEEVDRLIYGT